MRVSLGILLISMLAGCGDDGDGGAIDAPGGGDAPTVDGPGGGDGPGVDSIFIDAAAADGAPGDAPGNIQVLNCEANGAGFPPLDKSCGAPTDCAIALHMYVCCGSLRAFGINASAVATFNEAENACRPLYPGCGCPSQPTEAEDGRNASQGTIMVDCVASRCLTYVP